SHTPSDAGGSYRESYISFLANAVPVGKSTDLQGVVISPWSQQCLIFEPLCMAVSSGRPDIDSRGGPRDEENRRLHQPSCQSDSRCSTGQYEASVALLLFDQ